MVRPTLSSDVKKLEQEFCHGYLPGRAAFYVSTTNEAGESTEFTDEEMSSWGPLWKKVNDEFVEHIGSHAELQFLKKAKLYVCDGNHRLQAWMSHIHRLHRTEEEWHIAVDCIVLDTKGRVELVMQVMHDINK